MLDESLRDSLLDELAEDFAERLRRGDDPQIDEYATRYPDLAEEIRRVFETLAVLESANPRPALSGTLASELGDYRVLRAVGRGGMGIVYEAEQKSLGRRVALKILSAHSHRDETDVKRFRREAEALARLDHPNIIPVYDVGQLDGCHYFAMQFVRGQGLDELVSKLRCLSHDPAQLTGLSATELARVLNEPNLPARSRNTTSATNGNGDCRPAEPHEDQTPSAAVHPLSAIESLSSLPRPRVAPYFLAVARLGADAAGALDYSHGQGVLHRDIKPSNLLLGEDGKLWVSDFGLAKHDSEQTLTHEGDLVGTLRYMAPERFRSWSDPRSDVYSLGLVLYELLTLRVPYGDCQRAALVKQILEKDLAPPSHLNRSVPRDLETIVLKAIDKDPAHRYARASLLGEDIQRFLDGKPIRARRHTRTERLLLWCRRNRGIAALSAVLLCLLVVGLVASTWAAVHFGRVARERNLAIGQKNRALHDATNAKLDATARLYDASLATANAFRWSRRQGQRAESLAGLKVAAELSGSLGKTNEDLLLLRNAAINSMALADLTDETTESYDQNTSIDPTFRRLARLDGSRDLVIIDRRDQGLIARLSLDRSPPLRWVFSPDGEALAVILRDRFCRIWDIESQQTVEIQLLHGYADDASYGYSVDPLAFASDGNHFAVLTPDGTVDLWRIGESRPVTSIATNSKPRKILVSSDARQVALALNDKGIPMVELRDVQTGAVRSRFAVGDGGFVAGFAWSPDNATIACGIHNSKFGDIGVWEAVEGRRIATLRGHRNSVISLYFTFDGRMLVSSSWDGTVRLWDLPRRRTALIVKGNVRTFNPRDSRLQIAQSRTHSVASRLVRPSEVVSVRGKCFFASDDGRRLGTLEPTRVRFVDWQTSENETTIPFEGPVLGRLLPSGTRLIIADTVGVWQCIAQEDRPLGSKELLARVKHASATPDRPWCDMNEAKGFFAVGDGRRVLVESVKGSETGKSLEHLGTSFVAIHPAGTWLASGAYQGPGIRIWDPGSGTMVRDLWPDVPQLKGVVGFSADGRYVVANSKGEYRFWRTGTWNHVRTIKSGEGVSNEGRMAFTSDGRVMALTMNMNQVHLYDMEDFRRLAVIDSQEVTAISAVEFSANGRYLLMRSGDVSDIWDLDEVCRQLSDLGLNW